MRAIRFLRSRIVSGYHWLRDGPKIPGYPFTANWTLVSQFLWGIQSSIHHWFRGRNK
jgi:hypothetical protein